MLAHCLRGLSRCGTDKCNAFVFDENAEGAAFWTANGRSERRDVKVHQWVVPPLPRG